MNTKKQMELSDTLIFKIFWIKKQNLILLYILTFSSSILGFYMQPFLPFCLQNLYTLGWYEGI